MTEQVSSFQWRQLGICNRYNPLSRIEAHDDGTCTCELDTDNPVEVCTTISPFDLEMAVLIRGPINLRKFAFYVTASYSGGSSGYWNRYSYYDSGTGTAEHTTFLANNGENNTCLGQTLRHVNSDGTGVSETSHVLDNVTLNSGQQIAIYSGRKCQGSSTSGDCGVYRSGTDAYHGFPGVMKTFLFEFAAPTDTSDSASEYFDLPEISLINADVPRTSMLHVNENCSTWAAATGRFDIFLPILSAESNQFYSAVYDTYGRYNTSDGQHSINPNISYGYLERTPGAVMRGGVVLAENIAEVFLSNETTFNETLRNRDLTRWLGHSEVSLPFHDAYPPGYQSTLRTLANSGTNLDPSPYFFIWCVFAVLLTRIL